MLSELSSGLPSGGAHVGKRIVEILKLFEDSGIACCLVPPGARLEGDWDTVMAAAKRACRQAQECRVLC